MSSEFVKKFEESLLCNIAKGCLIDELISAILTTGSNFYLYFFRKCTKEFLDYQDDTNSSIVHGLVKSQASSLVKIKSLKLWLTRDVNFNKPDGNDKLPLDYLLEDNDCESIEVLLQHSHKVVITDKCLTKAFQLRNKQEKAFKLLFTYAVKHNIAPYLTGMSDGDTFLHEIMVQEKEKVPFKKWMGYFLSFTEININAVNNDGLTILDLLFMYYKRKRCKYTIQLLIKYRIPNASNNDASFELPLFLLNQKTRSQQFKKEFFKCFSKKIFFSIYKLKRESWLSKCISTTDNEVSVTDNENIFSCKYLKLKRLQQVLGKLPCKSEKSSLNNRTPVKLPNCEESETLFETKVPSIICHKNKTKSSQKSITETAKSKKYLSSKEAVVYCNLIGVNDSKTQMKCTQMTSESNNSTHESNDRKSNREENYKEESSDSGFEEESTGNNCDVEEFNVTDYKGENKREPLQKLPTVLCTIQNPWKNELLYQKCCIAELSNYRKLGQRSFDVFCNGKPCVAKAVHPEKSNKEFLKEINILSFLDHPNIIKFVGVHYYRNMPLLVMERMWVNLSTWLETNPSSSHRNKIDLLTDVVKGLKYLHLQNVVHCNLNANNILVHRNSKAKISDFRMADKIGKNITQLPTNPFYMPPEVCASNTVYTEKSDIFSFGCVVIHTITHELPVVDINFCSEIDKRYKYLDKIKSCSTQIYSIVIACLQDDPSCRPSAKKLYYLFKGHFKLSSILLKDCVSETFSEKSYSVMHHPAPCDKKPSIIKPPEDVILKEVVAYFFGAKNHSTNQWVNVMMGLNRGKLFCDRVSAAAKLVNGLKYFHLQNDWMTNKTMQHHSRIFVLHNISNTCVSIVSTYHHEQCFYKISKPEFFEVKKGPFLKLQEIIALEYPTYENYNLKDYACDNTKSLNDIVEVIHHYSDTPYPTADICHKWYHIKFSVAEYITMTQCKELYIVVTVDLGISKLKQKSIFDEDHLISTQLSTSNQKNISVPQGMLQNETLIKSIPEGRTANNGSIQFHIKESQNLLLLQTQRLLLLQMQKLLLLLDDLMNCIHGLIDHMINCATNYYYLHTEEFIQVKVFGYITGIFLQNHCESLQFLKDDTHEKNAEMATHKSKVQITICLKYSNKICSRYAYLISNNNLFQHELNFSTYHMTSVQHMNSLNPRVDMMYFFMPYCALLDEQSKNNLELTEVSKTIRSWNAFDTVVNNGIDKADSSSNTVPVLMETLLQMQEAFKAAHFTLHHLKNSANLTLNAFDLETANIIINAWTIDGTTIQMSMQIPNTTITDMINKNITGDMVVTLIYSTSLYLCKTTLQVKRKIRICYVVKNDNLVFSSQSFTNFEFCAPYITCNSSFKVDYRITDGLQKPYLNEEICNRKGIIYVKKFLLYNIRNALLQEQCLLHQADCHCMKQTQDILQSSKACCPKFMETKSDGENNPVSYECKIFT